MYFQINWMVSGRDWRRNPLRNIWWTICSFQMTTTPEVQHRARNGWANYRWLEGDKAPFTRNNLLFFTRSKIFFFVQVRWADIEEKKSQDRAREIGFVVGQTDWNKIMDDNYAQNALNKTKYIWVPLPKVTTIFNNTQTDEWPSHTWSRFQTLKGNGNSGRFCFPGNASRKRMSGNIMPQNETDHSEIYSSVPVFCFMLRTPVIKHKFGSSFAVR